jgi:hypothetical protein
LSPPKVPTTPASPDRTKTVAIASQHQGRLPIPGTVIVREYKGQSLTIKVLAHGFEYQDQIFKSLSAAAKFITGQHCSGFHFFRIGKEGER